VESASFELAGRLRTGFTPAQAEAECLAIWQSTMKDYYRTVEREPPKAASMLLSRGMKLEPLARGTSILRDRFGDALKLLMGAAALLLSIVCLNVAGLLLARTAARQQEITVRLAIGATRLRIMRQMIAESLLLVIFGCGAGMCIAMAATPLILRLLPPVRDLGTALVPLSIDTSVGRRVLLCSLLLSIITALICGVGPAIATSRWNLDTVLRGVRASGAMRGRQVLIALQIALCTFMLAETGLLLRTFQQLQDTPPGFARDYVATFTADLAGNQVVRAYLNALTERVRRLPGVASLAISSVGVMRGHGISASVAPAGQVISRADFMNVNVNVVSPEYFQTLGMRILSGRDFTQADAIGPERRGPERAVVNETFAKRFFPNTAPIGKRFGMGIEGTAAVGTYEIIGLVSDAKYRSLREPIRPMFYRLGTDFDSFVLNVRSLRDTPFAVWSLAMGYGFTRSGGYLCLAACRRGNRDADSGRRTHTAFRDSTGRELTCLVLTLRRFQLAVDL